MGLGSIFIQDLRDREVWWFLFPSVAFLMVGIHLLSADIEVTTFHILINGILVTTIVTILGLYTRFIHGRAFLNVSFGLGDLLFFYAFALGFPTITFIVLFVASILVALLWSLVYLNRNSKGTIPLAGLMSSFLILVYASSFFMSTTTLFII